MNNCKNCKTTSNLLCRAQENTDRYDISYQILCTQCKRRSVLRSTIASAKEDWNISNMVPVEPVEPVELLPCKKCKSTNSLYTVTYDSPSESSMYSVFCNTCEFKTGKFLIPSGAKLEWNQLYGIIQESEVEPINIMEALEHFFRFSSYNDFLKEEIFGITMRMNTGRTHEIGTKVFERLFTAFEENGGKVRDN